MSYPALKKQHGQNFLRDQIIADHATHAVTLTKTSNVFEIGPGDGFLTRTILQYPIQQLWAFEIDPEWAAVLRKTITDSRLTIFKQDFLKTDFAQFAPHKPWTLLANLPYHITFPILQLLVEHRDLFAEGVIMVQEEVGQKIVKTSGKGYGFVSLFFQHYFDWKLLDKVPPSAFVPPPKIYSRLLYFKPKPLKNIPDETGFWQFIKIAFKQPRRTLANNLRSTSYDVARLTKEQLALRAQQLDMDELVTLWAKLK